MICNVSFGILAFSPLGWVLMLIVILLEGFLLALFLPNASGKSCQQPRSAGPSSSRLAEPSM